MKNRAHSCAPRRSRGVTLIEVLVALVIVAIGLLGLAGMQVRGLSIQKDAHGRAIATQLALDLADRMRANLDPATAPAGTPPAQYTFTTAYGSALPTGATDCGAGICTLAQQAQFDVERWIARVNQALPGGWARVERPIAGEPTWNITLIWQEVGFRQAGLVGSSCDAAVLATVPANRQAGAECLLIRVRP